MLNEVLFIQSKAGIYPMVFLIHCHEIIGHLGYFAPQENPLKLAMVNNNIQHQAAAVKSDVL